MAVVRRIASIARLQTMAATIVKLLRYHERGAVDDELLAPIELKPIRAG